MYFAYTRPYKSICITSMCCVVSIGEQKTSHNKPNTAMLNTRQFLGLTNLYTFKVMLISILRIHSKIFKEKIIYYTFCVTSSTALKQGPPLHITAAVIRAASCIKVSKQKFSTRYSKIDKMTAFLKNVKFHTKLWSVLVCKNSIFHQMQF